MIMASFVQDVQCQRRLNSSCFSQNSNSR